MPSADTVLLPLCAGLSLVGVLLIVLAGRRRNKGRVIQGVGLALAPIALYLSGLLRLLWDGVVALAEWTSRVVLSPPVWIGLSLLALCLVLWVVGGFVARRYPPKPRAEKARSGTRAEQPAVARSSQQQPRQQQPRQQSSGQQAAPDDDMAEIEALLRSRGIE